MEDKVVKITFEVDGISTTVSSVEELQGALKGVENQSKKTGKSVEDVGSGIEDIGNKSEGAAKASEGALKVIDEATGGLGTKVKEVGNGMLAMGKQAVTAFKGAVQGASAMGKALIATGIGAIVVAVGLLVAYWSDIKGFVSGVSSEQKKLLADTEATRDAAQEQLSATEGSESTLRLAGKSEKEIRNLKIQQTNEIITATEAILEQQKQQKKAQVEAAERNKSIAQGIIGFLMAPVTILLAAVDALTYGLAKVGVLDEATTLAQDATGWAANLLFDPEEVAAEGDATIKETEKQLAALKNKRDGFLLKDREDAKKSSEDKLANERELNDELERLRAENIKGEEAKALALLEIEKRKQEEELKAKGASKELLLELDKNYEARKAEIEDGFRTEREAKEAEEEAKRQANRDIINEALQQAGLDSIENMYARAAEELRIQEETELEKLRIAGATEDEINKIKASYTAKNKKLSKEEADYNKMLKKQELANNLDAAKGMLDSITNLVGEGTSVGKAAAVASTTIDTYKSATAAYSSVVGIPVVGPALAPVAAGVAVAAGLMSVKKILSTKTPGNKSAGGGGGVPSVPQIPSFNPTAALGSATADQTVNNEVTLGEQQGTTTSVVKAFVVSSELTSQQEKDKKINELARL